MLREGLDLCAAAGCTARDLIVRIQADDSWLRYCPEHARELLELPLQARQQRLTEDLARCRRSWDWTSSPLEP